MPEKKRKARPNPSYRERYNRLIRNHPTKPKPAPKAEKKKESTLSGLYRLGQSIKETLGMGKAKKQLEEAAKR